MVENDEGVDGLHCSLGKRDLVEMLVDGGAPALESALLCACRAGRGSNAGHVETIKSLIRLGVDV